MQIGVREKIVPFQNRIIENEYRMNIVRHTNPYCIGDLEYNKGFLLKGTILINSVSIYGTQ